MERHALPPPPEGLDTADLTTLAASFMKGKLVCVASELGLFEHLADGPRTLAELAAQTSLPARSLRVLVHGLHAVGVLTREGDRYQNRADVQAYLTGRTSVDLRAGLRLFDKAMYPMWMGLEQAVRTGQPGRTGQPSEAFSTIFSEGVASFTWPAARVLPDRYDFSRHRRLLDIGGGTGSYLLPILARCPEMRATLFELPPPAEVARRVLAAEPARDRIEIVEGDALFDPLPEGHDAVLLAAFIHLLDPEKIQRVLRRVREALPTGGRLLIVDQWMDETHTQPVLGAMLGALYLILSGDGATYSRGEAEPWLREAGFTVVEQQHLAAETSLLVAEAT